MHTTVTVNNATALQVLANVASLTNDLHQMGYVHRNLKGSNVLWLEAANRWAIVDFGCAARIGEAAAMSFTLTYAPPEAARALHQDKTAIACCPSHDAWSVGVIAYEMITGCAAFDVAAEGIDSVSSHVMFTLSNFCRYPEYEVHASCTEVYR